MNDLSTVEMLALAGLALAALWAFSGGKSPAKGRGKARASRLAVEAFNELRMEAAATKLEKAVVEAPDNPHLAGFGGLFPKPEGDAPKVG